MKLGTNSVDLTPLVFSLGLLMFKSDQGTSWVVQLLRFCAPNAGGPGLIPG